MKKVYRNEQIAKGNFRKFFLRYTDLFICIFYHGFYFMIIHLVYHEFSFFFNEHTFCLIKMFFFLFLNQPVKQ